MTKYNLKVVLTRDDASVTTRREQYTLDVDFSSNANEQTMLDAIELAIAEADWVQLYPITSDQLARLRSSVRPWE